MIPNDARFAVDPLTGLPNRQATQELVARALAGRGRSLGPFALGLIDVDHLKEINARFFLTAGDLVLTELAKLIASVLRASDSLGRIGGDRFLVIAPETAVADAQSLGEHIRSTVERHAFVWRMATIPVSVSIAAW